MNCVICNTSFLKSNSEIDIFYTATTHSNTLIVNLIKKILNWDLLDCHSRYLCQLCFGLFEELDYAELSCSRLKKQLNERGTPNKYDNYFKDNSTQTNDENLDEISNNFLETIKSEISLDKTFESDSIIVEKCNEGSVKKSKPFSCLFCQKKFASKNGLNLHTQRQHQQEKDGNLNDLDKVDDTIKLEFEFDDNFKSDPEQSDSNDLDDKTSTSTTMKKNGKLKGSKQETIPSIKPLKYTCPQCPKMWRTLSELRSHMSSHSTLRPYVCEICGQAYKLKHALDVHIKMHKGIFPYRCQYCKKVFTQKGALQRHLPIHTGEAPYQCDLCGKRFVHHTSFNMHTLAHTGQKAYKCNVCNLALLSTSHLKRHMRVHTGERPYACTHCGKRFAERYNLAAHQRLHEAGPSELSRQRIHRCQVCSAGFDRRTKLEEHLSNDHNKIIDNEENRKWVGHFLPDT